MTMCDKYPVDLDTLIVVQVVTKVAQKFLVALWEVTWVNQGLQRTASNHKTVCALQRVGTWILYVNLCCEVGQALPSHS